MFGIAELMGTPFHWLGICGDCNGQKDDYKTKGGTDVTGDSTRDNTIGKSWEVLDDSGFKE